MRVKRPTITNKYFSFISSRIFILLFILIEKLSVKNAYQLGQNFGGLLFHLSIHRRKIIKENVKTLKAWAKNHNLKNALLECSNSEIIKKIYQFNAGNFFYSLSLMNKPISEIKRHIRISNPELLKKAYEKNEGLVMLFSHSGPWELTVMLPVLLPSYFSKIKMAAMYRPLNNTYMNKWYLRKRERFGTQLFSREDGFLKIIRHIKNGSFMNIAFDIRMHQGKKVELFDRLASTTKIPYALHKATKAPIVFIDFVRVNDLSWEIQFKEIASSDLSFYSESNLLKIVNKHLERSIFKSPFDYFFFQDRYK